MKRNQLIAFLAVSVLIFFAAYLEKTGYFVKREVALVARVIDGDTLELDDGRKVRLLGINAPEKEEFYFEESKNELKALVEGKKVILESDRRAIDRYGRLLRYVFVDGLFVNLYLVESGTANAYIVEPNFKYSSKLIEAESMAMSMGKGIWSHRSPYAGCLEIVEFTYVGEERVTFRNICNFPIDITGWKLKDAGRNIYTFSKFILSAGDNVTLYSTFGTNTGNLLYWNKTNIWTDYGDILILKDDRDKLVLVQRFG